MSEDRLTRLQKERAAWRRDHPWGFVARPKKNPDGSLDMTIWECVVPGLAGTPWQRGRYPLKIMFPKRYPAKPPLCKFSCPIFHPNVLQVYHVVMMDMLLEKGWKPTTTVKDILVAINNLLAYPVLSSPVNCEAFLCYINNQYQYQRNARLMSFLTRVYGNL